MPEINPLLVKYYGENAEDYLLWHLFDFKPDGFYIDVGAFDGRYLSNSLSFEQQGWNGICVEAHPVYVRLCRETRPGATVVHAACLERDTIGTVEFEIEELGVYSHLPSDTSSLESVRQSYEKRGLVLDRFETVTVEATTLNKVLEAHGRQKPIDFVSIDVEGGELRVLEGFDLQRYQPRVLVVEANTDEQAEALTRYLGDRGYMLGRRLAQNHFFVRTDEDAAKLSRVRMQCCVERHLHPKGLQYTFPGIARGKIIDDIRDDRIRGLQWQLDSSTKEQGRLRTRINEVEDVARKRAAQREALALELAECKERLRRLEQQLKDLGAPSERPAHEER